MAYEKRPNEGSLWKNDDKAEGDKRPNAKGSIEVQVVVPPGAKPGDTITVPMWMSSWTKVTPNNRRWQSVVLKEKERRDAAPAAAPAPKSADLEFDDAIPF